MLEAVESTTPQPATAAPAGWSYYSAQHGEWPPMPWNWLGLPFWDLGGGVYVVDDRQYDYLAQAQAQPTRLGMDDGSPAPPFGGSTNSGNDPPFYGSNYTFDTNGLWMESG